MKLRYLQFGITAVALLVAFAHLVLPKLTIDAITVTLFFIALIPWLAPLFKSLEFPGGLKVEFQDFERAQDEAEKAGLLAKTAEGEHRKKYSFQLVAKEDPILALAGLRIEIEKRLTDIAESKGLKTENAGVGRLLRMLSEKQLLSYEQHSVLADMVVLLNKAVHGENIDERAAEWALDVGVRLLNTLEAKTQS